MSEIEDAINLGPFAAPVGAAAPDIEKLLDTLTEVVPLARVDMRQYGDRMIAARSAITRAFSLLRSELAAQKEELDALYDITRPASPTTGETDNG